jgi:hypothetical protein
VRAPSFSAWDLPAGPGHAVFLVLTRLGFDKCWFGMVDVGLAIEVGACDPRRIKIHSEYYRILAMLVCNREIDGPCIRRPYYPLVLAAYYLLFHKRDSELASLVYSLLRRRLVEDPLRVRGRRGVLHGGARQGH